MVLGWRAVVQLCQAEAWHLQAMGALASELEASHLHVTTSWTLKPWEAIKTRAVYDYAFFP